MFEGLHGLWLAVQTMTGNHFDSHFLVPGDIFAGMKDSEHDKKAVCGVGSQLNYPDFSCSIAGKGRVASLVRTAENTNFKHVAVRTLLCWQCVFLLSLSLLQFGLVKGCDLCDVWFVTHVC